MSIKRHKISLCVVCVNCLYQLKETISQNIFHTLDYDELDFIILDYNSKDGTDYWIKENINEYLLTGKVKYYKTFDPYWSPGHSMNVCFKLSGGQIIGNISAGDFIESGFVQYLNKEFEKDNKIILTSSTVSHITNVDPELFLKKLCLARKYFLKVHGFDERISRYKIAEYDIINRLGSIGITPSVIKKNFAGFIIRNHKTNLLFDNEIFKMFIHYNTPSLSEIFILYKNKYYLRGVLIDQLAINADDYTNSYKQHTPADKYTINDEGWETGLWKVTNKETLHLSCKDGNEYVVLKSHDGYTLLLDVCNKKSFYAVTNPSIVEEVSAFKDFFYDILIMRKNIKQKASDHSNDFGRATVFKNYLWAKPILV